jgi:hypothetical protein
MPHKDPEKRRTYALERYHTLKTSKTMEAAAEKSQEWRQNHPDYKSYRKRLYKPEVKRAHDLMKAYGITIAQYEAMLQTQGGVCAICSGPPASTNGKKHFHVDHDHVTGKVRGLLCGNCNQGIGKFKDDGELLFKAAAYLKAH